MVDDNGQVSVGAFSTNLGRIDSFNTWLKPFFLFMMFKFFYYPDFAVNLTACVDVARDMAVQRPPDV